MGNLKYTKRDLTVLKEFVKGNPASGDLLHTDGQTLFRMNPSVQNLAIRESKVVKWLDVKDDSVQRKLKSILPEGRLQISKTFSNSSLLENYNRITRKSMIAENESDSGEGKSKYSKVSKK